MLQCHNVIMSHFYKDTMLQCNNVIFMIVLSLFEHTKTHVGPTNRPTDRQTDRPTCQHLELLFAAKKVVHILLVVIALVQ